MVVAGGEENEGIKEERDDDELLLVTEEAGTVLLVKEGTGLVAGAEVKIAELLVRTGAVADVPFVLVPETAELVASKVDSEPLVDVPGDEV